MSVKTCTADGCVGKQKARLLCGKHYARLLRNGDHKKTLRNHNGAGHIDKDGYFGVSVLGKRLLAHIVSAEKAIGKPLPAGAVVHHADGNKLNNKNSNLVICQNRAYHNILHARMRAAEETGNPNMVLCCICRAWGTIDEMYKHKKSYSFRHRVCHATAEAKRKGGNKS